MRARDDGMEARAIRLALVQFNEKSWSDHIAARFAAIGVSSLFVLAFVGVRWGAFIAGCALVGGLWDTFATRALHRMIAALTTHDDAQARAKRTSMIAIVAAGSALYCLPYCALALAPSPGPVLGMIFAAGAISLIIGQHVLTRTMSLWTLPTPTLALAVNAMALAPGWPGLGAAALAIVAAINAAILTTASWRSSQALINAQLDAEDNALALEHRVRARTEELAQAKSRAEAASSILGQLTGGIAHDFNNALTAVASSAEALGRLPVDDPRRHQILETITLASVQASSLTRKLLAYSRQQVLEARIVNLNDAVEEALHLIRPLVGAEIRIETNLDSAAPFALLDPGQLASALMNLAVNARDAMPAGGTLWISTDRLDAFERLGPSGVIEIRDTGCGMDADIQTRIFDPYFTTKSAGRGNGLGLSMVQGFVLQSGGAITLDSAPGEGTRFRIGFPLCAPRADETPTGANPVASRGKPSRKAAILLVEDNDLVRNALLICLESAGHTVTPTPCGATAIALMEAGATFDLLVTDVVMPGGMDGLQVAAEVLRRAPEMKVLVLSGYAPQQVFADAGRPDGVEFLQKPVTLASLQEKIHALMARDA